MHRDGKKENQASIQCLDHDAPTVSARLIYGSSTSHDGSAMIHHGGATNAQDASTIRYGASTIQAGSARVASQPPMNVHDLVIVMRQSWREVLSSYSYFFFIRRLRPSIYSSPQKISGVSSTPKKFEILATKNIFPILYLDFMKDPKMHRNVP